MASESKSSFALIFVLWLAGLGAASQFAKISVIFPQLRQAYPEAGLSAGFLVSLLSLCGVALGLSAGIVVAKFGYRFLLLVALVIGALVSAFQAMLPPLPAMLASRMIEGISHLIIVVAAPTLIAQLSSDRHRAAALTLWGTFFGVAFALVAWFGLPLVNAYGIGSLFAAHAAVLMLVAILLFFMLPVEKAGGRDSTALGLAEVIRRHIETYRSPFIAAPAMGWLFYTLSFVSGLTLLPGYVDQAQRVWAVSLMPLASIAVSMTIGVLLLRHMGAVRVIILGFAVSAVFAGLVWITSAAAWACVGLFGALGLV
ncbi:MAG: MFS transporter, partial [Pseudomonadota bacterium]|nr:MFS transporter [Pseudomonadota bacterium]